MSRNRTTAQRRAKKEKEARKAGYKNYDSQQYAKKYGDEILEKPWVKSDDTPGYHYPGEDIYGQIKYAGNKVKKIYDQYTEDLKNMAKKRTK